MPRGAPREARALAMEQRCCGSGAGGGGTADDDEAGPKCLGTAGGSEEAGCPALDLEEEMKSLCRVVQAYLDYPDASEAQVRRWEQSYNWLPPKHKALLPHLPGKYAESRRCISANSAFISAMLQAFQPPFDLPETPWPIPAPNHHPHNNQAGLDSAAGPAFGHGGANACQVEPPPWLPLQALPSRSVPPADVEKVRCILRSIVREWAAEGAKERQESFQPILKELKRKFGTRLSSFWSRVGRQGQEGPGAERERGRGAEQGGGREEGKDPGELGVGPPSCLVPGAGLGRLPLEICRLGFSCQGNEFSFYTLICSNFLLNCCSSAREWVLYPWVLSSCNQLTDSQQLKHVLVPDVIPSIPDSPPLPDQEALGCALDAPGGDGLPGADLPPGLDFSMCAGDFVEVYSHPSQTGAWDSVATCFFLDTAHNVVEYMEVIWRVLKPGGVWVNVGPLLYHFADAPAPFGTLEEERRRMEMSLELSLEDIRRVAQRIGFFLDKEEFLTTTYTAHEASMMHTTYKCVLWTMVKS